jgi:hypothetical protein
MNKNKKYTEEDMENAINAVQNKEMSQNKSAAKFGVPRSTLSDKLKNKYGNVSGAPTLLGQAVETLLASHLIYLADIGFAFNKKEIFEVVKNYLIESDQTHIFKNNMV